MFIEVPTWNNGKWDTTVFQTREEFKTFVLSVFKKPGEYEFDETTFYFNEQAKKFNKEKIYTISPENSKDWINYWGALENEFILSEKSKCRNGVIFINKYGKKWYLTRDYYFWINFLPIYDKEKKAYDFPEIWDSQYHAHLYELLAELHYKHAAELKKRQWGNTYMKAAKLINRYWFEKGQTLKMGASLKDYINEKGAWKFLNEYKNFLNKNTGWYRESDPDKVLTWQQRQKIRIGDKDVYQGNQSTIIGHSFEKDPTAGVGGNISIFYHEEAGIAPKMDTTYEFIRPALSSGMITTGLFIAAGSVGDLDQCKPLKEMILNPIPNSIYAVETDLLDDKGTVGYAGLFIPEQWSMFPYIDRYGNSIIDTPTKQQIEDIKENCIKRGIENFDYNIGSLEAILKERKEWKKGLSPEKYQLRISQKPINIHEAFAYRKESKFPLNLINAQILRIEEHNYPIETVNLVRDKDGNVEIKSTHKSPISILGNKIRSLEDKTSVVCIYERPIKANADWGTYYMSVDPVKEGRSVSSESLCSTYVYKTDSELTKIEGNNVETFLERGKIVASWCGRYDDLKKTHELLEMMSDLYNAQIICEANVSEFITYMQHRRKQHRLVSRERLLSFNKDMKGVSETFQEYGWKNSTPVFLHLLSYVINYLKEELDTITKENGEVVKTIYGVERIPDIMLLREMQEYDDEKGNYDRLVAFAALVAFVTIENANRGFRKTVEKIKDLDKPNKLRTFIMGPEQTKKVNPWSKPAFGFKNFR